MIVAPSILSLDYSDTKSQLDTLLKSRAKWIHFDVMDGHFVNNLSFGPHILSTMKKSYDFFYDVHLMVEDPNFFQEAFIKAGADCITFHYEVMKDFDASIKLINDIKSKNIKVGMSIKPSTPVEVLKPFIHLLDLVLVMSVEPGFGGQAFIEASIERIKTLKKMIVENNSKALIEVDGGINNITGKLVKEAGADVLVAGSYIFKNDIIEAVDSLC